MPGRRRRRRSRPSYHPVKPKRNHYTVLACVRRLWRRNGHGPNVRQIAEEFNLHQDHIGRPRLVMEGVRHYCRALLKLGWLIHMERHNYDWTVTPAGHAVLNSTVTLVDAFPEEPAEPEASEPLADALDVGMFSIPGEENEDAHEG